MGECTKKIYEIRERYRNLEDVELWTVQEYNVDKLIQFFIESDCAYLEVEIGNIKRIEYKDNKIFTDKGENIMFAEYEDVAMLLDYLTEQNIL